MAERKTPKPLEIALAVAEGLESIGRDETLWLTRPVTPAKLMSGPADLELARPVILVRIVRVRHAEHPFLALDLHDDMVELDLHYLSADGDDPQQAVHEGAADVRRWVRQNHGLQGKVTQLWETGYDVGIDGQAGGAGAGEAVVHVSAIYGTDEENP